MRSAGGSSRSSHAGQGVRLSLAGKVCLITGSGSGLGLCLAEMLAQRGAAVILNDHSHSADALREAADRLNALGHRCFAAVGDVSDPAQVDAFAQEALRILGKIDILVNNAGINIDSLIERAQFADWTAVLGVHLNGTFNCTRAVFGSMKERRFGRIINISSVVGLTGIPGTAYYATAKAGVLGFTRAIAAEGAQHNITANAVALGYVDVGMGTRFSRAKREQILQKIPLRRFAQPEEIAGVVAFLASDEAAYITGSVINVSGGFHM
ncbi:MAG: SDR family oxidoreductase [Chloroflexota bacterium]|nr:MAG: SDR family oxidoreductase [Chloroflexota bacterium]